MFETKDSSWYLDRVPAGKESPIDTTNVPTVLRRSTVDKMQAHINALDDRRTTGEPTNESWRASDAYDIRQVRWGLEAVLSAHSPTRVMIDFVVPTSGDPNPERDLAEAKALISALVHYTGIPAR
jgi:hypothetical protein